MGKSRKCFRKAVAELLVFAMIFTSVMIINPSALAEAASAKPAISKTSKNILVGDTYNLNIKNQIKNSTYKWSSSNKSVATVNSRGIVKGVKKGNAVITCTVTTPNQTYKLTSNVTIRKPATYFVINNKVTALNLGQKYNLNRTLAPSTSNDLTTWTSSDKEIAIPDSKGKFTALKEGTVTITGKTLSGKQDEVTIKVVDSQGTVATQEELEQLLGSGAEVITIKTDAEIKFTIPSGDYSSQKLIVDAPNADVVNNGNFKAVDILKIKANTWYEQTVGNVLNVSAPNARISIAANASAAISVSNNDTKLAIVNNGTITGLTLNADAEVSISGTSTQAVPIIANVAGATVTSSVPLDITCNEKINLVILPGAEATVIHVASSDLIPVITGSTSITVIVGTGDSAQTITVAPTNNSSNSSTTTGSTVTPTPTPSPTPIGTTKGTITGRVTVVTGSSVSISDGSTSVSGGSISVSGGSVSVSGGSISVSGGSISVSGGAILADVTVRAAKYDGNLAAALASIETNANTTLATTNELGIYSAADLDPGNYVVVMSKPGYKILVQLASVTAGSTSIVNGSLIELGDGGITNGIAGGDIINALSGEKVDESLSFTVSVYNNFNNTNESDLVTTQTVSGAAFTLNLPEGYYTIKVTDDRSPVYGTTFAATTQNIVVLGGTNFTDQDIVLSTLKEDGQATFVLTWGEYPSDLDSHLIGPVVTDENYHIYFANKTYPENTEEISLMDLRLDIDDVTSYGPETTSIYHPVSGGIYTFFVYNYSGNEDGTLVNSNAKVVITTSAGTYTFDVPTTGTTERSWVVCTYNSATGVITPINQLVEGNYYENIYGYSDDYSDYTDDNYEEVVE